MRNIIAHMYDEIDYTILQGSIGPALRDFGQVVALLATRLQGTE